ncbi:MAG: tetratricopeptide repeat protein [Candidatus Sumerlaeaceae bacterium]
MNQLKSMFRRLTSDESGAAVNWGGSAARTRSAEFHKLQPRYDKLTIQITLLAFLVATVVTATAAMSNNRAAAVVWCFSLSSFGFLTGFLFGIPKVVREAVNVETRRSDSQERADGGVSSSQTSQTSTSNLSTSTASEAVRSPKASAAARGTLAVNTNLEEISDWLTKIIVGLGLVELRSMPDRLHHLALSIAGSLGSSGTAQSTYATSLALGMIVGFPSIGFLGGYLSTRLFLQREFSKADEETTKSSTVTETIGATGVHDIVMGAQFQETNDGGTIALTDHARVLAEKVANLTLSDAKSPDELSALGLAKMEKRNFTDAVAAFAKAVEARPEVLQLRIQYAYALWQTKTPQQELEKQLESIERLATVTPDQALKEQAYQALLFLSLYLASPTSYEMALRTLEKYETAESTLNVGSYVNAACAYGQKYIFLKSNASSDPKELEITRRRALEYVQKAVAADPKWAPGRIAELMQPGTDDDLTAFAGDPEFEKAIGKAEEKET